MATFQEEKDNKMVDDRISTLLRNYSESNSSTPISFEYYPPKTEAVVYQRHYYHYTYINHHQLYHHKINYYYHIQS